MRFIGIPRVSSKKQAESGDSIEAQISRFKQWSKNNNNELVEIYQDSDKMYESATINDDKRNIKFNGKSLIVEFNLKSREPLVRAIQEAKNKDSKWEGILIFKWDRISRDPPFLKLLQIYLESFGKVIVPTDDPIDPLASDIVQLVSKYEIDKLKARVREVRKLRFEKGMFVARSPLGYKPILKDEKVIGFKIDAKKAECIIDIFKMAYEGIDYREICKKHKIAPQSYYNILKNKAYIGLIEFEGQIKEGIHEPLISKEIFYKLNPHGDKK
jgi:site-specific DNA recombinase